MDDLVSRQKVLQCIKESRENIDWVQSEDGDAFLHYLAALYRTIASKECLPSAQQWIQVSERLPEKDGHYIVYAPTYSGGSSSSKEHHDGVMFSAFKKGKWSIEHGYHKRPNCVVAWMPLPDPYKRR